MPPSSPRMAPSEIGRSLASSRLFCGRLTRRNSWVPPASSKDRADPHRCVGMQEVETAPRLDPEEEIKKGGKSRRLARLIRPVDDVQVRLALRPLAEIDAADR